MEVCRPPLIWMNDCCYRKPHEDSKSSSMHELNLPSNNGDVMDEYEEDVNYNDEDEITEECQYDIEESANGKFSASFHLASAFFPMIIGKKGATKKRLEAETQSRINIPRPGVENEDVTVKADSKFAVANACHKIDMIVANARKRQGFTHFISIPVNHHYMQEAFVAFKKAVLEMCPEARGLDESIFQTPSLLHMTIGTLALMDQAEREKAADLLKGYVQGHSISTKVEIKGLEIMNDDPREVDVIYGKVGNDEELQLFADGLVNKFAESGLMVRQFDRVKLHVTLLNTIFRNHEENETDTRETMDALPILELFGEHRFASVNLKEIHLSQRRAGKRSKENYYFPTAIVQLSSQNESK